MLAASAQISAQIQAAQSSSSAFSGSTTSSTGDTTPSSSGLIWPVSGVVTSGFGYRWGRMHEGIDIAAPTGTAVHAAAAGSVIYAGGMSGYGNIVVIDHGAGSGHGVRTPLLDLGGRRHRLAGPGHRRRRLHGALPGPHLHFEVRVNGSPVDPLGYL